MRKNLGTAFVLAVMLLGITGFLGAEEGEEQDGGNDSLSLGFTVSSLPEAQVYQKLSYRANNMASPNDSWSYENDGGENRNAPHYYGSYVLGYQFPAVPILDTAALMAEMDYHFYDTPNRHAFGDDRPLWTFSFLVNTVFTKQFSAALATQFKLDRNFISGTEKLFYQNRILDQNNPYALHFYRVAAILTYKLW
jgi:hypothetical protein